MATLKILVVGNPLLKQVSRPVEKIDKRISRLLKNMAETMYAQEGVGLAAPQIGVLKRMVVIDVGDGILYEMINPVITGREGSATDEEGCLSVPDYRGQVERSAKVVCEFTNRQNQRMQLTAEGLLARAIQHELDHLDGVLFLDRALSVEYRSDREN